MKIAKRGPVLVKLDNGNQLDLWYDPNIRLWTLQLKDAEGNQIGPGHDGTAAHHHSREDAVAELEELAEAANAKPVVEARSVTVTDAWGHKKIVGGFGDVGSNRKDK